MTDFPDDSIDTLIARQLPAWLTSATPEQQARLRAALLAQEKAQACLRRRLQAIEPLEAFAERLLIERLYQLVGKRLDVRRSQLRRVALLPEPHPIPGRQPLRYHRLESRQSLLSAALHNFAAREQFSAHSDVLDATGSPLPLSPAEFARVCRELDLGAQYQAHLHAGLADGQASPSAQTVFAEVLKANLQAAVYLEHLRGRLGDTALAHWASLHEPGELQPRPHELRLLGMRVIGLAIVEVRRAGEFEGVLSWIADDPLSPCTWHPSWTALYTALAGRLANPAYRSFFKRFIAERDRVAFDRALLAALATAGPLTPAELDGRHTASEGDLFEHLAAGQLAKLLDDARVMAVPTGDEDRAARDRRIREYAEAGLDLLGVVSLFVPALGVVMLGVTAVQLTQDIYQGYEDWQVGDRAGALEHLFDVAGLIAGGLAVGAAGHALGKLLPRRPFVDGLSPVLTPSQGVRLSGLQHELEAARHGPAPGPLLRSLGAELGSLTDAEADAVAQDTGLRTDQLRRLALEGSAAPSLLLDALALLRLHQRFPALQGEAFELQLRAQQAEPDAIEQLLLRDFPGLTQRAAAEVVRSASGAQLASLLETQRVPLALAEQARWLLRDGRLNRACTALRAGVPGVDAERLALTMLEDLAPVTPSVRIEIRDASVSGNLLAHTGAPEAGQLRLVVRGERGYRCFDQHAAPLPASQETDDLGKALWHWLDSDQREQLGSHGEMLDALARHAARHRGLAARGIGLAPVGAGLRPPMRLGDGRLGYPLSGRGESARQAWMRGVRQVFPTLDDAELQAYRASLRQQGIDLWQQVAELRRQLDALRAALDGWSREPVGAARMLRRRRVGDIIRRCWRRKSSTAAQGGHRLSLDGEVLGGLPLLPEGVAFAHITELTLRNMALDALPAGFLGHFPNLRLLNLRHNQLTAFPEGLGALPKLEDLRLGDNHIVLDEAGNRRLQGLASLRRLDLSRNPLGRQPALGSMHRLREYSLRGCALPALPGPAGRPALLESADYRDNRIQSLNDELLSLPRQRLQRLALHDNPLQPDSARRLSEALQAPESAQRPHAEADPAVRDHWLGELSGAERAARLGRWERLRAAPGSDDFFRLLADLAHSLEFRRRPVPLRARIWQIVRRCEQNGQIRQAVFQQAAGPRSCADQVLLILAALEVRVRITVRTAGRDRATVERELLQEGRALFRLDQVQRIASTHYQEAERAWGNLPGDARPAAPDDVEVFLAYRTRLAQRLGLPDQPQAVRYEQSRAVSAAQIDQALHTVLAAETPQALSESLQGRDFWTEHLRTQYAERFDEVSAPFHVRLEQLWHEAANGPEQAYLEAIEPVVREHQAAQAALRRQLTDAAVASSM